MIAQLHKMKKINIPKDVNYIIETLQSNGFEAFMVGGCVRDELLNKKPNDYDICTSAKPEEIKKIFIKTIDTGIAHGTVTVRLNSTNYEVTTYRIDGDYLDNRHPSSVSFTSSLKEDLARRDFTINAMAYSSKTGLIDFFNGQEDLKNGIIRAVGEPSQRFDEDALRILRAVRFSAQLGFKLDENTAQACKNKAPLLKNISQERIRDELFKICLSDNVNKLVDCYELSITKVVFPEFDTMMETTQENPHHIYTVGIHTIKTMENLPKDLTLRLAGLFHDIGKPACKTMEDGSAHFYNHPVVGAKLCETILEGFHTSKKLINDVSFLVLHHQDQFPPVLKSVRRGVFKIGLDMFPSYLALQRADCLAQSDLSKDYLKTIDEIEKLYLEIKKQNECLSLKDLKINGYDLINLGYKGKEIGTILSNALKYVIDNPNSNDKQTLLNKIDTFL